jgi:dCMP deaminase
MKRESLDVFFMKLAYSYAERSTCIRRNVGTVIVKNNIQISGGYNGAPKGMEHCNDSVCIRKKYGIRSGEKQELCRGAHSEANAIAQAAQNGINIDGTTMYCTTQPCVYCAKLIANSGIKRLVFSEYYGNGFDELTKEILQNIQIDYLPFKKDEN